MLKGARQHRSDEPPPKQAAVTVPAPPSTGSGEVKVHDDTVDRATRVEELHVPSVQELLGDEEDVPGLPSARPTTVPDYDVEALAAASSWEHQLPKKRPQLALDVSIPVRKRASMDGAPLRAAFLLLHVDDRLTIAEIAATTQIPLAEAIENFVLLVDLGVVELRGGASAPIRPDGADAPRQADRSPASKSGLRAKT